MGNRATTSKRILALGACLLTVGAASAGLANGASAQVWVLDICVPEKFAKGEYIDPTCWLKASPPMTGGYEHKLEAMASSWFAKIVNFLAKFEDTGVGIGIECGINTEGALGPGKFGSLTKVSITGCLTTKGSCVSPTVTAINLPWEGELYDAESQIRDKLIVSGGKSPGWKAECTVLGVKVKDECTGETSAHMENVEAGVGVEFDSKSAHGNCTVGGSGAGVLTGKGKIETGESEDFAYIE